VFEMQDRDGVTGGPVVWATEKAAGTELAAILELIADGMGEEIGRRMRQDWEA
jgi:hypothetical protein